MKNKNWKIENRTVDEVEKVFTDIFFSKGWLIEWAEKEDGNGCVITAKDSYGKTAVVTLTKDGENVNVEVLNGKVTGKVMSAIFFGVLSLLGAGGLFPILTVVTGGATISQSNLPERLRNNVNKVLDNN